MSIVKLSNNGVKNATAFGSLTSGSMTFIKKLTASSSGTLSFVDGSSDVVLDNTYKEYLFTFNNIHPATDGVELRVNFSIDGGSNYNVTKTTTHFVDYHNEGDSDAGIAYITSRDLAQGTSAQPLCGNIGNDNDQAVSGYLHLFNPSSTTFVKHFIARVNEAEQSDYTAGGYTGGYCNTTSAIDAVQFSLESGNMDSGDICLYGIN